MKSLRHPIIERMVAVGLLSAFLLLTIGLSHLLAQTGDPIELSESYRLGTDRGTLAVNYPEGWQATGAGPGNIPYVALQNQIDTALPTMLVQIVVIQATDLPIEFDLNADNLSLSYFEAFKALRLEENRGAYGEIVPVEFGNDETTFGGALMMLLETDSGPLLDADVKISVGLSAALDESTLLIAEFQTDNDIFDSALPLWSAMIDTLLWNDVGLANPSTRAALAGLETPEELRQFYLEIQDQQNEPNTNLQGVDSSNTYSLQAGEREVVVSRPIGWVENSREDDQVIRFENADDASTFFKLQWLEDDGNSLSTPLSMILRELSLEGEYDILDTAIFSMDTMPSVGVSYRLGNGQVGMRFGLMLPNDGGLLEITLQSTPPNWLPLQGLLFGLLSGLQIDDAPYQFTTLLQAYQSLQNPIIVN